MRSEQPRLPIAHLGCIPAILGTMDENIAGRSKDMVIGGGEASTREKSRNFYTVTPQWLRYMCLVCRIHAAFFCRSPIEMSLPSRIEMSLGQAVVETFVASDDGIKLV